MSLDLTSWEAASDLIHGWEAAGEIDPVRVIPTTVPEAVDAYIADGRARRLADTTISKHREILERRFLEFCKTHGIEHVGELSTQALRQFRGSWNYSAITSKKRLEYVKAFLQFCVHQSWLRSNPADGVKPPRVDDSPTLPFSDSEVQRILTACATARTKNKWGKQIRLRWTAMTLLLRYSGMRISDASTLERSRLVNSRLLLRTQKTKKHVWIPLPAPVVKALEKCPNRCAEYFFWSGHGKRTSAVNLWERAYQAVFRNANVEGAHIHRFRTTFAVDLLSHGTSVETVATLLGNSPAIVLKHYAPWVQSRQLALEAEVRKIWTAEMADARGRMEA
jgi:integrase/recombinase XerD